MRFSSTSSWNVLYDTMMLEAFRLLSELSLCLLPVCCAARTPRSPHAALALLLLVPRTHRATTAHAAPACGRRASTPPCTPRALRALT